MNIKALLVAAPAHGGVARWPDVMTPRANKQTRDFTVDIMFDVVFYLWGGRVRETMIYF